MMATPAGTGPARRWPRFAVVLAAVLIAVALVAVYFALKPPPTPTATPPPLTPTISSTTPSVSVNGAPTVLADGCLGGPDPIKAMLIAQETAPLTSEGAAAFAATLMRWIGQVPQDPAVFNSVSDKIRAPSLPPQPLPSVPDGTSAWVSTTDARYRVTGASSTDITVEGLFTQTSQQNETTSTDLRPVRFELTAVDGHWALKGAGAPRQALNDFADSMRTTGLPYQGGC